MNCSEPAGALDFVREGGDCFPSEDGADVAFFFVVVVMVMVVVAAVLVAVFVVAVIVIAVLVVVLVAVVIAVAVVFVLENSLVAYFVALSRYFLCFLELVLRACWRLSFRP